MKPISVKNLTLQRKNKIILNDCTFEVPDKAICAFIGPNGAGKTTTIKCLLDLYKYSTGEIQLNGIDSKNFLSRQDIGYIPEKENFSKISVNKFLSKMAMLNNIQQENAEHIINDFLREFDIFNFADSKLTDLSSGQKKKVLIIQALLSNPKILIMDEPTENMDPDARQIFYKKIKELHKVGKTIFICTHQLDEIKQYVNYAVFINNGHIKYAGDINKKTDLYKMFNKYKY
jgi:ABC-2 type transport system ATP-binding protein